MPSSSTHDSDDNRSATTRSVPTTTKKRTMQEPTEKKRRLPLDRLICHELAVWNKWDRYQNKNNRGAPYGKLFQRIHVHQQSCGELEFQTALATLQGRGVIVEQGGCYRLCGAEDRVAPNLNEEDGEEDRAINNATGTNYSELVEEDAPAAPARSSTSSRGTLRTQNGGGSPSNTWHLTPVALFIRTLGYMDNTTLMIMCLVCKQIRDIIWTGHGMETKLVRIFELHLSENNNFDDADRLSIRRYISNMNQHFQNVTKTRILQGLQHWKLQDMKEFNDRFYEDDIDDDELERVTQNIRMTGIVSLDMSSPLPSVHRYHCILYRAISFMVPNLQQLDLSHTEIRSDILEDFAVRCPRLEIIRWNDNNDDFYSFGAKGYELDSLNTLRELYFDNCYFGFDSRLIDENEDYVFADIENNGDDDGDNGVTEIEAMSDSNNYPNIFLFQNVNNNPLERVSLRNARYKDFNTEIEHTVPQQILMKFVRKAPATLVWFRSDLSATNIHILQSERPGIQFLN